MDPLSAIASIVGIVGFGIQIAQILQKEIDAIQTATERVEQIVIEIRATATGLTNLQDFLLQDQEASVDDRIFNDEGRVEVAHVVRRCNTVFRNITVLVAKAGNGILSSVDQFQRQLKEEHENTKGLKKSNVKLEIELSNLEHLMWPWRLPKIEQYIADLDRLKLSLVLILSVANLAKTKKQKKIKARYVLSILSTPWQTLIRYPVTRIPSSGKEVRPKLWSRMKYSIKTEACETQRRLTKQSRSESFQKTESLGQHKVQHKFLSQVGPTHPVDGMYFASNDPASSSHGRGCA